MSRPRKYPEELLERGVRLALESGRPIAHVAADLGIHSETLRERVRQAMADQGLRSDLPTSEEREEMKRLRLGHTPARANCRWRAHWPVSPAPSSATSSPQPGSRHTSAPRELSVRETTISLFHRTSRARSQLFPYEISNLPFPGELRRPASARGDHEPVGGERAEL